MTCPGEKNLLSPAPGPDGHSSASTCRLEPNPRVALSQVLREIAGKGKKDEGAGAFTGRDKEQKLRAELGLLGTGRTARGAIGAFWALLGPVANGAWKASTVTGNSAWRFG